MTNVKIRIEVNPNSENENLGDIQNQVDGIPSSENVSNVSVKINGDGLFQELPSKSGGINGLSLAGDLVFDEFGVLDNPNLQGGVLESTESPVEFIWGVVPESGEYKVRLVFTDAKSLKDVVIYGDSVVNQFPTQATIDGGKVIYNDDLQWAINFGEESDTHVIEFTHWNLKNYNACISKIAVMLKYLEVDKHNGLKEIESTSQSSSDTTGLYYGSIENYGSIEIVDTTGEIIEMIQDGVIDNSNTNLEIVTNEQVIQSHISTDSSFDRNTKVLSLELGNRINSLDILKYKGYNYPEHSENLATLLFDVLSNLKYVLGIEELTEDEFKNMLSDKYDSTQTLYDYLYSCIIDYPVIKSNKTYREVIDEFCVIAQMQMFIDDSGNIKFVSARPKVFDENFKAIHIPKGNMFSQLNYNLILKNKYDGVEIYKNKVIDSKEIDTTVFSQQKYDTSNVSQSMNNDIFLDDNGLDIQYSMKDQFNNYGVAVSAVKVVNYYATGNISFPKKSNNNLNKILGIRDNIIIDNTPLFTIYCDKYEDNNVSMNIPIIRDRNANSFTRGTPYNLQINYPLTLTENFSGYLSQTHSKTEVEPTYWGLTTTAEITTIDESNYNITFDGENYNVEFKILCGQDIVSLGANYFERNENESAVISKDLKMTGNFTRYVPKYISFSINGDLRVISFEEISASSQDIESKKTKVSINSSQLLQTDEMVENIKNNILKDYALGVSSGSATVSCSDYYDSNGEKVVDWVNGDVLKVGDVVYFDNDKYKDGFQRYWKIKGRTFRKTGVPMQDLELEEVFFPINMLSWDRIGSISSNAYKIYSVGDEKDVTLSTGEKLTFVILGFNHDDLANGIGKAGISWGMKNLMSYKSSMHTSSSTDGSYITTKMRNETLPIIYEQLPSELKQVIKTVAKKYNFYSEIRTTNDDIWLLSASEYLGANNYPNIDEGLLYDYYINVKNLIKNTNTPNARVVIPEFDNYYWTRTYIDGEYIAITNGSVDYVVNIPIEKESADEAGICFGFCT